MGSVLGECDYAGLARSLGLYGESIKDPAELQEGLDRAFRNAPSLLDVAVTRDAPSPDFLSGLPRVPDHQPLEKWDKMERIRMGASHLLP